MSLNEMFCLGKLKKKNETNTNIFPFVSPFTTSRIEKEKIYTIVNVGSYKTRVIIAKFLAWEISILGYWEKRQSRLDVVNNEIINTSWVCDTISEAIVQAKWQHDYNCNNIIINPFFSTLFFFSKKIAHKRKDPNTQLTNDELSQITSHSQWVASTSITHELYEKFWMRIWDVESILNYIPEIQFDWKKLWHDSWNRWEDLSFHMMNCYIPKENYKTISDITSFMGKKIIQIIPEEYSLTKIDWVNDNAVYVNIWNTSTLISIKDLDGLIIWSIRVEIGIWNLIKQITQSSKKNRSEIIKKLDREDLFLEEKAIFLQVFTQFLFEGLKEILWTRACPEQFIISWWWAHNDFIKTHLSELDFSNWGVKIIWKVSVNHPSIDSLKDIVWVEEILSPSTISILSQVLTTNILLQKKLI